MWSDVYLAAVGMQTPSLLERNWKWRRSMADEGGFGVTLSDLTAWTH